MEATNVEDARAAFERHAWREAYEAYQAMDALHALEPDDLERMAQAAWWISHVDACLSARERAFAGYLAAGEPRRAAYEAVWIARDNFIRRRRTVGLSWARRAETLLEGVDDGVELAYLEQLRSSIAEGSGDVEAAARHAARAVELGARHGDRDIQARALTNQGEALILLGHVDEGMSLIDEATVAAVGGELSPMATGIVYCNTISSCSELADMRRAAEWTEAAKRWCERQAISGFPGLCRVHRASIERLRGAWGEAEREARVAAEELTQHSNLTYAAAAFNEVGEIRLRIGDLGAAESAFRQADELGRSPQPGLARVHLARGDLPTARSQIERALEETAPPLHRAVLLPAVVEIALAAGDLDPARTAAEELTDIADRYGTDMLRAEAATATGSVLTLAADARSGVRHLREAVKLWRDLEAPYEAARARELLGRAYRALGDEPAARQELESARASLTRLGAGLDVRRLSEALGVPVVDAQRVRRAFLFSDIVGSTRLIESIGDDAWTDLRRWHDGVFRASFGAHGGEEVDHAGDGFFVAFPDASSALACAVGVQQLLAEHRRTHGFAPRVRIGVHVDDATRSGTGYSGRGVHAAARIGAAAGEDEIMASVETVEAAGGAWRVSTPRETVLKGIDRPIELVSVDWRQTAQRRDPEAVQPEGG